jgi:hypothetical protein
VKAERAGRVLWSEGPPLVLAEQVRRLWGPEGYGFPVRSPLGDGRVSRP